MLLSGKNAFVTGGSRGIGQAIVARFLEEGANVYYYSRTQSDSHDKMHAIAQEKGVTLQFLSGTVDDEHAVSEAILTAHKSGGSIDILVNNAGITKDKLLIAMKKEDWDEIMNINLTGIFYTTKTAVPVMMKQRSGSIINMSSIVGISGNPGQSNYAASKAGIIGFSKSIALELAKRKVRVNVVAPGFINTSMTNQISEEYRKKIIDQIPMQRTGDPTEVANTCVFLGSDYSSYITGQVISVSGGLGG